MRTAHTGRWAFARDRASPGRRVRSAPRVLRDHRGGIPLQATTLSIHPRRIALTLAVLVASILGSFAFAQSSGGTIVFAGNQEPASIDPTLMSGNVNEREVAAQIFETLVYIDQDQVVHPGLASAWTASDD